MDLLATEKNAPVLGIPILGINAVRKTATRNGGIGQTRRLRSALATASDLLCTSSFS